MYYLVIFDLGFDFYALDYESILQIWDIFLLVVLLLLLTGNLNKIKNIISSLPSQFLRVLPT